MVQPRRASLSEHPRRIPEVLVAEWTPEFESVIREFVPFLGDDTLTPELDLYELGLDSLNTVALLIAVEDLLGVELPDSAVAPETFQCAGKLWQTLSILSNGAS